MKFMDESFLLKNKTSQRLFFDYAEKPQIFDFHCHLNPGAIYENSKFQNITEAWLGGDHYKWRAMRSAGFDESLVTGDADPYDKFHAFVKTLELAVGNPIYHWAHLELQRFFGIFEPLTAKSSRRIYDNVNEKLASEEFRVRNLIQKSNVKIIYTTDDPADDLKFHSLLKNEKNFETKVSPAFRPDKAINIDLSGFPAYIDSLSRAAACEIKSFGSLKDALLKRIDFFAEAGCKASDHGIAYVPYEEATDDELNVIFEKGINGCGLSALEIDKYKTAVLKFLGCEYAKRDWVMEIHVGVLRNNNSIMFKRLGPDTGYDSIGDYNHADGLIRFMDSLEAEGMLPKTVLFSANPKDNYILATMIGCFQAASESSKIQLGTAWWFNDSINGMTAQIAALGNLGVLGKFIGMLTDSRSFLSYPRHEYFRRILCNMLGTWIEDGEYYADEDVLKKIIEGICIDNALCYFGE